MTAIRLWPGLFLVATALAAWLRKHRQRTAVTSSREVLGRIMLGMFLSLPPLAVHPHLSMAQNPRSATAQNRKVPATYSAWQEVSFDSHMFLQLHPGWYHLKNSNIYFVIYPDMTAMSRGLDRVACFIEKSETKGTIVLRSEIKVNTFFGHDYSVEDIAKFFNKVKKERREFDLSNEERDLKEHLLKTKLLKLDRLGKYHGQERAALLGFTKADQYPSDVSPRPMHIYIHEIFHGLWFTTDYRHDIAVYWNRIPAQEKKIIIDILYQRAQYDPNDLPLIQREFASYFRDYEGQEILASSEAQQLAISQLEEYQRELRNIEQPYIKALTEVLQNQLLRVE